MARKTDTVIFRLDPTLRARLDEAAAHEDITVSDLLRTIIKEWSEKNSLNVHTQVESMVQRMVDAQAWFGLSALELPHSLDVFGVRSLADLRTPDKVLANLTRERLEAFATSYELDLNWLLTGQGSAYRASHLGLYVFDSCRRISELWLAGELTRVRLVSDRTDVEDFSGAGIILSLEKKHPHPALRELPNIPFRVNESFPLTFWDPTMRWPLANIVLFCHHLHRATSSNEVYPSGTVLLPQAFEAVRRGKLHLAQALHNHASFSWSPQDKVRDLDPALRDPPDDRDRELLKELADKTLLARRAGRPLAELLASS